MQSSTPAGSASLRATSVIVLPTRTLGVSHWVKRKEIMKSRSCRNWAGTPLETRTRCGSVKSVWAMLSSPVSVNRLVDLAVLAVHVVLEHDPLTLTLVLAHEKSHTQRLRLEYVAVEVRERVGDEPVDRLVAPR